MANKGNGTNNGSNGTGERSRVRVIIAEAEGTSTEIQQLIVSVAAALKPAQQVFVYPQQLPATAPAVLPAPAQPANAPGLFDGVSDDVHEESPVVVQTPAPPKPKTTAKRKYKTPTPVPDLEFTNGPMPLQRYMDEQSTEEHSKRYLAIAFWLKEYRSYQEIGSDHVYSCYRALNLNVPDDVLSVFRAIKRRGWVVTGSEKGLFKINHIGEGQLKKVAA